MLYSEANTDPLESFLTRLLNDAVQEASADIVSETVRELARSYVDDKQHEVVFDDLFNDYMDQVGPDVVSSVHTILHELSFNINIYETSLRNVNKLFKLFIRISFLFCDFSTRTDLSRWTRFPLVPCMSLLKLYETCVIYRYLSWLYYIATRLVM